MPHSRSYSLLLCLPVLLASDYVRAEAGLTAREEAEAIQDRKAAELAVLMALPRLPTCEEILKDTAKDKEKEKEKKLDEKDVKYTDAELTKINNWVQKFMDDKNAKAQKEVDEIKKRFQEQEQARLEKEKERQRRLAKLADYSDLVPIRNEDKKPATVKIKLDFQLPEIETCRRAAEVCRQRKALNDDIVEALSRLDRNNDGKLAADEYQDAMAIVIGAAKLFQKIDSNEDGLLSEAEIDDARKLPKDAFEALQKGRPASRLPNAKLKPYDANDDGILDAEERKVLSMAFVDLALKAEREAEFYRHLGDCLTVARDIMAAKYASLVLGP